jgi:hypothetical protein
MGPYLCIQCAIFLDKVIYRAFTEYVWLGRNPYLDENVMRIARIINAAAKAIRNLHEYYDGLELCGAPVPSRLFPHPRSDRRTSPIFSLHSPKSCAPSQKSSRLLFGAEMTEQGEATHLLKKVVVKVAERHENRFTGCSPSTIWHQDVSFANALCVDSGRS